MRVIAKKTVKEYFEKNASAKQPLLNWFKEISSGNWKNHNEMKKSFSSLSIIPNERIVFNIKGNKYRMVSFYAFHVPSIHSICLQSSSDI
jgi:mRNA interferase HigB